MTCHPLPLGLSFGVGNQRFEVLGEFARGGCSILYRVRASQGGGPWLAKFPKDFKEVAPGALVDEDPLIVDANYSSLEREGELLLSLQGHPRFPKVMCAGNLLLQGQGQFVIIMEHLERHITAEDWLRQSHLHQTPLNKRLYSQLAEGFRALLQRGFVNKDFKLDNMLFLLGQDPDVRMIDLGGVQRLHSRTTWMHSLASPAAAPEQFQPGQGTTTFSNMSYSLGYVLYALLTFRCPPPTQDRLRGALLVEPRILVPQIDPILNRLILQAMEMDPARRLGLEALLNQLEQFAGVLPGVFAARPTATSANTPPRLFYLDLLQNSVAFCLDIFKDLWDWWIRNKSQFSRVLSSGLVFLRHNWKASLGFLFLSLFVFRPPVVPTKVAVPLPPSSALPTVSPLQPSPSPWQTSVLVRTALNLRFAPVLGENIDVAVPKGTPLDVQGINDKGWAEVYWQGLKRFAFAAYFADLPAPYQVRRVTSPAPLYFQNEVVKILPEGEWVLTKGPAFNQKITVHLPDVTGQIDISHLEVLP